MTTECPACDRLVIVAILPGGATVTLNPRANPRGEFAARTADGARRARYAPPGAFLADGETRHQPHKCAGRGGGLEAVRSAQAKAAHKERATRGRRPRVKPVAGVRKAGER